MKKIKIYILTILLLFPLNILAYSNKIAIGGETIGIEVHSKGVYIVGFYNVNNKNIGEKAGFKVGDIIKRINNTKINNINDLNNTLTTNNEYIFEIERNNEIEKIPFTLIEENDLLKTGLYVKDQINGIGTLSYIDPETKIFGALGHEIVESASLNKFNIDQGTIYKAEVSTIKKSTRNESGEKNADILYDEDIGIIKSNEFEGIFGLFNKEFNNYELLEVGDITEIKKGPALIKTVVSKNKIESFDINILSIDESANNKNIFFEITDEKLLNKTGGIIQGMSGSPIIQNNKIIGVVNYVVVEEANKGYGIFITTMLNEGDKLVS